MKRINKREARKRWNNGEEIVFTPCKCRPDNIWGLAVKTSKGYWANDEIGFDKYVNEFEWYNCDHERGYYAAYYVE